MITPNQSLKILLVEDDSAYAELIEDFLSTVNRKPFDLRVAERLSQGVKYLHEAEFDAVLLDLCLPDSFGLDTLKSLKATVPTIPIIVLTGLSDENMAITALRYGAQDYLVKGQFHSHLLIRSVQYAIERQRTEEALRQQAERERLLGRMIERIRSSVIAVPATWENYEFHCYPNSHGQKFSGTSTGILSILQNTAIEVQQFLKTDCVFIYACQGIEGESGEEKPGFVAAASSSKDCCFWSQNLYQATAKFNLSLEQVMAISAVENVQNSSLNIPYKSLLLEFGIQAVLSVPIWKTSSTIHSKYPLQNSNCLWGLLTACQSNARSWQPWEIDFLKHLALQVAVAVQQSELYHQLEIANQKLQQLAVTDELTGIANRRQFDSVLEQEWQRLTREQVSLSLILCDIDFFKLYNDCYGHLAGDACLQQVARAIASALQRPADLAARYGGEEFAAILPYTDRAGAVCAAEKIRERIEKLQLSHPCSPISQYVTLSLGIASTVPSRNGSPRTLVQSADRALYQAKAAGRNCIFTE